MNNTGILYNFFSLKEHLLKHSTIIITHEESSDLKWGIFVSFPLFLIMWIWIRIWDTFHNSEGIKYLKTDPIFIRIHNTGYTISKVVKTTYRE